MAFVPVFSLRSNALGTPRNSLCRVPLRRRAAHASVPRMVATEPVTEPATSEDTLSERAMELMSYIRGHKSIFRPGIGFSSVAGTLSRKNDTVRMFTPPDELQTNAKELPGVSVALLLHDQADALTDAAQQAAKEVHPCVSSDDIVTDIFRYDVNAILRAISYGAAVQTNDFLHDNNAAMMTALHDEVGIPSQAMLAALNAVKDIVLPQVDDNLRDSTASCFQTACNIFT